MHQASVAGSSDGLQASATCLQPGDAVMLTGTHAFRLMLRFVLGKVPAL